MKALHDAGVCVSIVNPAQVRNFAFGLAIRNKTDDMNSFVLARYGALIQPNAWIPPSPKARTLHSLLTRRDAIAQDLLRENNRLEKADSTATPALIRQSLMDSIDFLTSQLAQLQKAIEEHTDNYTPLRSILSMAAMTATRYNPHIQTLYLCLLERGKSKRSALCAAMRKLVHLCFGVLKSRKPYDPNYTVCA